MRKLERGEETASLREMAEEWTRRYVERRNHDNRAAFFWPDRDCYLAVRTSLLLMTQRHCAFCDGGLGTESRETVEHFRPKSRFPELAYKWDNLFPCCDVCQSQKKEKFDEGLLKPDEVSYEFRNYFTVNFKTGAIEPSLLAAEAEQHRAEVTIELYGLNKPERKQARLRELRMFHNDNDKNLDEFNYRYFLEYDLPA